MYYVQFIDNQGKNRLGSDASLFIKDLKTIRGVISRIANRYNVPQWAVAYSVAQCTEETKYKQLKDYLIIKL